MSKRINQRGPTSIDTHTKDVEKADNKLGVANRSRAVIGGAKSEPAVQRKALTDENEETIQRKGNGEGTTVSTSFQSSVQSARGQGSKMDQKTAGFMSDRFGKSFDGVKIHNNSRAHKMAMDINARAFTVGQDVFFNQGEYQPETCSGKKLLAHELTHTIQQDKSKPSVQRQPKPKKEAPKSGYEKVHDSLFGSQKGGTKLKPWKGAETASKIKREFLSNLMDLKPHLLRGKGVTRKQLDTEITALLKQIKSWFPMITKSTDPKRVLRDVKIMKRDKSKLDPDLTRRILTVLLERRTDLEDYAYSPTDKTYIQLQDDLLKIPRVKRIAENFAINQTGYNDKDGRGRVKLIINEHVQAKDRPDLLVHEFMHYFSHNAFDKWLTETNGSSYYAEGFAEYATRHFSKAHGIKISGYESEFTSVKDNVAKFIPDNDIFRAFFAGEVWRLEHESKTAKEQFKKQVRMDADSSGKAEVRGSRSSRGINQSVSNKMYRFANFEIGKSTLKRKHKSMLKSILNGLKTSKKPFKIAFIGYANDSKKEADNIKLSKARAGEFNKFAQSMGITPAQIVKLNNPEGKGSANPIAGEKNAIGRAFNRRVELKIIR